MNILNLIYKPDIKPVHTQELINHVNIDPVVI